MGYEPQSTNFFQERENFGGGGPVWSLQLEVCSLRSKMKVPVKNRHFL
jgi:hypothetical protein